MFDLSPEKLLVILIIALIVLGPERLPKAARSLGKVLAQARAATAGMQDEVRDAIAEPRRVLDDTMGELGLPRSMPQVPNVRSAINAAIAPRPVSDAARAGATAAPATDAAGAPGPSPLPDDPNLN